MKNVKFMEKLEKLGCQEILKFINDNGVDEICDSVNKKLVIKDLKNSSTNENEVLSQFYELLKIKMVDEFIGEILKELKETVSETEKMVNKKVLLYKFIEEKENEGYKYHYNGVHYYLIKNDGIEGYSDAELFMKSDYILDNNLNFVKNRNIVNGFMGSLEDYYNSQMVEPYEVPTKFEDIKLDFFINDKDSNDIENSQGFMLRLSNEICDCPYLCYIDDYEEIIIELEKEELIEVIDCITNYN